LSANTTYDVAITGGGLGGLSLSILLAKAGHNVVLIEKENYPFHRVCGEYISFESWNFLEGLGYPLSDMELTHIKNLVVSAPNGKIITHSLPLGGFGISRFKIDAELADLARKNGVTILEGIKVNDIQFAGELFMLQTTAGNIQAKVAVGCFGKRSKLNNYIGVKYHIRTDFPADTIALHNFNNGYCGISRVENGAYCLCYLTTASNLKRAENNIPLMEQTVLYKNPHLEKIFTTAEFLWKDPVSIAQISFERKSLVENHILMAGDAAGMITPLCGNGMSMAMHSSKVLAALITRYLHQSITRAQLEKEYSRAWNFLFKSRLQTGRLIQQMFGKPVLTNLFLQTLKPFPKIVTYLIRQTHGEPF
jgi:menaquinone-9 beta-reductase